MTRRKPERPDYDRIGELERDIYGADPVQCARCGRPHAKCAGHRKRDGLPCDNDPMRGQRVCRMHGGKSPGAEANAERRLAEQRIVTAWSALAAGDVDLPGLVDPARAVMAMLHMSWLRVHLYAGLLERQVADGAAPATETGDQDADGHEDASTSRGVPGPSGGLVGHVYAADKQAGIFASGEAIRALVQLEAGERDRCVRFAKTAHDMGIADREIELAEAQTRLVALAFARALEGLPAAEVSSRAQVFIGELRGLQEGQVAWEHVGG